MKDFNSNDNINKIMEEYISSIKKDKEASFKISHLGIFLLAFSLTVLILNIILMTGGVYGSYNTAQLTQGNNTISQKLARPGIDQRMNVLVGLAENKNTPPEIYILIGYMPDKGYITVSALPHITYVGANRAADTLNDCYTAVGMRYTAQSLGSFLGISIPYHIFMTYDNLNSVINTTGSFKYEVIRALNHQHENRHIRLDKGVQEMTARTILDIMTYPQYTGAEQDRSDIATLIATATLNDILLKHRNNNNINLKKLLFDNSETSITGTALESRIDSFAYLLSVDNKFVLPTFLEGELSKDYSLFLISEKAIERLKTIYS